jgi:hypothetical protein
VTEAGVEVQEMLLQGEVTLQGKVSLPALLEVAEVALGRMISVEEAVGPPTPIDTKLGFDPI